MFDIGFSELLVIAVVALIVIGPERLPRVARTVGHLLGRAQRYVNTVKADINREMELDELRKLQGQIQDSARSFEQSINQELSQTEQGLNQALSGDVVTASGELPPAQAETAAAPDVAPDATTAAMHAAAPPTPADAGSKT